jgi:hypothetical protein
MCEPSGPKVTRKPWIHRRLTRRLPRRSDKVAERFFFRPELIAVFQSASKPISLCISIKARYFLPASPKGGDGRYDAPELNPLDKYQDFGHSHWHNSLIWGENVENVSLLGPGLIWGKGLVRNGGQSRIKEQNDALRNIQTDRQTAPFGYPNPRDAVESGWENKAISLKLSLKESLPKQKK